MIDLKSIRQGKHFEIEVNENNQSSQSTIFAIGDVIDKPNLTPVAIEQGRVFSDNYFGNKKRSISYKFIPKAGSSYNQSFYERIKLL